MITPFKGRDPYGAGEVAVYKNLNTGGWSITAITSTGNRAQKLADADTVQLVNARTYVAESRRRAIADGAHREVCAWIIGKLADGVHMPNAERVTFRPRECATFFNAATSRGVDHMDAVEFRTDGNAYYV